MSAIDVILPVYNSEKTLDRCLKSIKSQTFGDFRVLMINDGSTDNSYNICMRFAEQDYRFQCISQANSGPSIARNRGLEIADADYIVFVDSDDYIESDYFSSLFDRFEAESTDVVFIGFNEVDHNGNLIRVKCFDCDLLWSFDRLPLLVKQDMFGYTWSKAFRRDAIGSVRFKAGMSLFEDELFTCNVLKQCRNYSVLRAPLYNYVTGYQNALTRKTHQHYPEYRNVVFGAWTELIREKSIDNGYINELAHIAYTTSKFYFFEHKLDDRSYLREMRSCDFLKAVLTRDAFWKALVSGRYEVLKMQKIKYNIKVALSSKLKG